MADARPTNSYLHSLLVRALTSLDKSNFGQAERYVDQVLQVAPRNADALQLLGLIRRAQNRPDEAIALYQASLSSNASQPEVEHNLGNAFYSQKRFSESIAAQTRAILLRQDFISAYVALALGLSESGNHQKAIEICQDGLRMQPLHHALRQMLAAELIESKRPEKAVPLLMDLLRETDPQTRIAVSLQFNLAMCFRQQGRYAEALSVMESIHPKADFIKQFEDEFAILLFLTNRYREAKIHFLEALSRDHLNVRILAFVALSAINLDQYLQAQEFIDKALAIDSKNALALTAFSRLNLAEGRQSEAIEIIKNINSDLSIGIDSSSFLGMREIADVLEISGQFAASFAVTTSINERRFRDASDTFSQRAITDVEWSKRYWATEKAWGRRPLGQPALLASERHIFIVGFMRSGTTLLASAMNGHEDVVAADELDFLSDAAKEFLSNPDGIERLSRLQAHEISSWSHNYWQQVWQHGLLVSGKTFVDKLPFNSLRLPLIAKFFPNARVLFAIRDPRDVVLSCMRQKFELTAFSYEFLRLQDCARFYASAMELTECHRNKLPIEILDCRYEEMVADYERTMRAICSFTGIGWQNSMAKFSKSSGFVNPLSASANQIKKDLYSNSVGQWQHYKAHLEPVLPILQPWISQFGYAPE